MVEPAPGIIPRSLVRMDASKHIVQQQQCVSELCDLSLARSRIVYMPPRPERGYVNTVQDCISTVMAFGRSWVTTDLVVKHFRGHAGALATPALGGH